jgi:hypothetical protein
MKSIKCLLGIVLIFFAVVFLTSCSSSSTPAASTIISGTVASGAPVVGYVSVYDSSTNNQPVKTNIPIAANGNYSVDTSGLTPPYAFLATGTVGSTSVSLYSAATATDVGGTINITPFTNLMIMNIAAGVVQTYINSGGLSNLTVAQLNAQSVALTDALASALTAMGLSGSIDLLRAAFNADNTGLDRFMDLVQVNSTNPSAVTITNILDAAQQLIINTTASTTSLSSTGSLSTTGLAPSGTPLEGIMQTLTNFASLFATSLPSSTDPNLLALISSNYLNNGTDRSAFLNNLTTPSTPSLIGMTIKNVVINSINSTGTIAQINFTGVNGSGVNINQSGSISEQMQLVGGVWQFYGNQHIADVEVSTFALKFTCNPADVPTCTATTNYSTGLEFYIENKGAQAIGSAVVTGPGLPSGGVTLIPQAGLTSLWITTTNPNYNNPSCNGECNNNEWAMTDTDISALLPNSVYTVKLYDTSAPPVLLDSYTEVVPVAPILNTALPTLAFPSISGMVNLSGLGAATLTPSWSIPTGLVGESAEIAVWLGGSSDNLGVSAQLSDGAATSGSSILAITAPSTGTWSWGFYSIKINDIYGGIVNTIYQ